MKIATGGGYGSLHGIEGGQQQNSSQAYAQKGADADAQKTQAEVFQTLPAQGAIADEAQKDEKTAEIGDIVIAPKA